jgi:peptide/nickel transport system substrate-binding protein
VAKGGHLNVVVVASQWPGLDPATDTQDAADAAYLNAIMGQLVEAAPSGVLIPDEASGWVFSNHNSTVTITIRAGVKFSNGDPLTAADVAWSINRDLEPQYGNIGDVNFPLVAAGATSKGNKVVLNMTHPDVAIMEAFIDEAPNWTVDENALNAAGEASFAQKPIGSGPFTVVSNTASAQLVVAKNPTYWQKGHPLLDGITWTNVGNDQSAVAALQAGQEQMATGVTTIPLLKSLPAQGLKVTTLPAITSEFIDLNVQSGPFSNILAREAVQYATNAKALNTGLYDNAYAIVESQTGPGQLFYQKTNKYFRAYNLAKATALVQQLGGLTVSLSTTTNNAYFVNEVQAIATMWEAAGIKVNIQDYTLQQMLNITFNHSFQAIDENWGPSVDPSIDLPQFFYSTAAFSGVKDGTLDGLLNQLAGYANPVKRQQIVTEIANLENKQAYGVFMYAKHAFDVTASSVQINGAFSSKLLVPQWENIGLK